MGVPGFFAWLMKNNKHNNILAKCVADKSNALHLTCEIKSDTPNK